MIRSKAEVKLTMHQDIVSKVVFFIGQCALRHQNVCGGGGWGWGVNHTIIKSINKSHYIDSEANHLPSNASLTVRHQGPFAQNSVVSI